MAQEQSGAFQLKQQQVEEKQQECNKAVGCFYIFWPISDPELLDGGEDAVRWRKEDR